MEMTVSKNLGIVPVTVLGVEGSLDGSNYSGLIAKADEILKEGSHDLLLDLGKLRFVSSAGISALHRVSLLFSGKRREEMEEGWAEYHAMQRDLGNGFQQHVKLLNPNVEVKKALELTGFSAYFEIYTDIQAALTSFH